MLDTFYKILPIFNFEKIKNFFGNNMDLPVVASAHGHEIDVIIWLTHFLMFGLFIGWGIFFIFVLFRFNRFVNPKANYTGATSHFSSYIEMAVIIAEVVLLIGFSIPFWAKQVNALPDRADAIEVRVVGEQFLWNIHYPGKDKIFGKTDLSFFDKQTNPLGIDSSDPNGKDDIVSLNQLYLPIGKPVIIYLSSKDVMHSFFIPVMRAKQDVIPGVVIPTWFTPTKTGKWEIACAQLCGLGHSNMRGFVTVQTPEEFDQWIEEQTASASEEGSGGGDDFWN